MRLWLIWLGTEKFAFPTESGFGGFGARGCSIFSGICLTQILWGSEFRTRTSWQNDSWYIQSLLPWWPLLQTWACPLAHVRIRERYATFSIMISTTYDWDLFLNPLRLPPGMGQGGDSPGWAGRGVLWSVRLWFSGWFKFWKLKPDLPSFKFQVNFK